MTSGVFYDPTMPYELDRRWSSQAARMSALKKDLASAPTEALPASALGAAQTFLDFWENIALQAEVASEVYADELRETGTSYESLDAEVARRMDVLTGEAK